MPRVSNVGVKAERGAADWQRLVAAWLNWAPFTVLPKVGHVCMEAGHWRASLECCWMSEKEVSKSSLLLRRHDLDRGWVETQPAGAPQVSRVSQLFYSNQQEPDWLAELRLLLKPLVCFIMKRFTRYDGGLIRPSAT